jgi:DNA-binding transcriptional ArsR family regulator
MEPFTVRVKFGRSRTIPGVRRIVDVVPEYEHPDIDAVDVTAVLFALSDPARLDIVRQVAGLSTEGAGLADLGPRPTCQSVAVEMPKSTRSHHLKVLREAGVTRMVPQGRESVIALRRDDLDSRWPGLLDAVLGRSPDRSARADRSDRSPDRSPDSSPGRAPVA